MTNQLLAELEMANKKIEEKDKEIERLKKENQFKDLQIEEIRKEIINQDKYIDKLKKQYDKEIEELNDLLHKANDEVVSYANECIRLNNIIDGIETYCNIAIGMNFNMNNNELQNQIVEDYTKILDKLKELKEGK